MLRFLKNKVCLLVSIYLSLWFSGKVHSNHKYKTRLNSVYYNHRVFFPFKMVTNIPSKTFPKPIKGIKKWGFLLYINEFLHYSAKIYLRKHTLPFPSTFNFIWVHKRHKFKNWSSNQIVEPKTNQLAAFLFEGLDCQVLWSVFL